MFDHIWIGAVGIIISVMALIGVTMMEKIGDTDLFSSGPGSDKYMEMKGDVSSVYDWAFPAAGMLSYFGVIAMAWLTPNHPIFAVFSMGLLVIGSLIMPTMANVYLSMSESGSLEDAGDLLPLTRWYIEYYPVVFIVMGITMLWAMYTASGGY